MEMQIFVILKEKNDDAMKYIYRIALRKAKIVYNFGLSECNTVKLHVVVLFFSVLVRCQQNVIFQRP